MNHVNSGGSTRGVFWVVLLVLLASLASCKDSSESPAPLPPKNSGPLCSAAGAQLLLDLASPVAGYTWNDPFVIKEGANYWMYASATDSFVFPVELFRFGSTDGTGWALDPPTQAAGTPMLGPGGAAGTWDDGGAETPAVVFFNGNYHLFYTTYETHPDDPSHSVFEFRIGHAVSADGVTGWAVDAAPVVSPGGAGSFNEYIVGEPAPVVFNSQIYLYFTAVGFNAGLGNTLQVIGLVTSADGASWSAPASVLEPGQGLYPRADGWVGYSTPQAIEHGGMMHLFVDVAYDPTGSDWKQVRLHHARSADGVTGWMEDARPLLLRESLAWTQREVRSPSPLDDNGTLRLYFAGDSYPTEFGIGVTQCPGLPW